MIRGKAIHVFLSVIVIENHIVGVYKQLLRIV